MRLIDADALKEKLRELWVEKLQMPMEDDLFLTFVMCDIDNAPTIGDVQVYHARGSKILGKEAECIIDEANAYKREKGESHDKRRSD